MGRRVILPPMLVGVVHAPMGLVARSLSMRRRGSTVGERSYRVKMGTFVAVPVAGFKRMTFFFNESVVNETRSANRQMCVDSY